MACSCTSVQLRRMQLSSHRGRTSSRTMRMELGLMWSPVTRMRMLPGGSHATCVLNTGMFSGNRQYLLVAGACQSPGQSSRFEHFAKPQLSRTAQHSVWHASRRYHWHTCCSALQCYSTSKTRAGHLLHVHVHLVVLGQVLLVDERMRVDLVCAAAVADVGHQRDHRRGVRRALQAMPCQDYELMQNRMYCTSLCVNT